MSRRARSTPEKRYWPEVGVSRQPRTFMHVDLPDPLGPMTATSSPASIESEIPPRAFTSASPAPYTRVTSRSSMRGASERVSTASLLPHGVDDHLEAGRHLAAHDLRPLAVRRADLDGDGRRPSLLEHPDPLRLSVLRGGGGAVPVRGPPRRTRHQPADEAAGVRGLGGGRCRREPEGRV